MISYVRSYPPYSRLCIYGAPLLSIIDLLIINREGGLRGNYE